MRVQRPLLLLLMFAALSACKSGNNRDYYDDYGSAGGFAFTSFNMIDTSDVDSRNSSAQLTLDAFNTDGQFKAFWTINTRQNYEARLFVNTSPSILGRRVFGYAYCGGSDVRTCYLAEGTFYCSINVAGTLACEDGGGSYSINDWLINNHRYFLGLEICSTQGYGCSTKYQEVTIY
jgi:hypothetical protein